MSYDHKKIEAKWQKRWEKEKIFQVKEDPKKKKFYVLDMFPYPSAEGLHVGHPEGYTATDIIARKRRMEGWNVLHPMGFDAFGLPTENYAIKYGIHPRVATEKNIKRIRAQIKSLGFSYDWSREINTTDPNYYKWTQWIFLKIFRRGLAYQAIVPINWCPSCKTGLANEEVVDGKCERCKTKVTKKDMRQWMLKITAYADRLLEDLKDLDWPEQIKEMQRNWIGRSEGAEVTFQIIVRSEATKQSRLFESSGIATPRQVGARNDMIKIFTTRPDTLFGATYLVVAPEHPILQKLEFRIKNSEEVKKYVEQAKAKSDLERQEVKEKTGVELKGVKAINPVNGAEIPIWVADYVLPHYGTGAIMAVPAHDERDFEFAKKFGLPIIEVISGGDISKEAYLGEGKLVNSAGFNEMSSIEAREKITEWLAKKNLAKKAVNYKLRDWVFSRQRYWGEPIPLVYCEVCKNKKYNYILIHGFKGHSQKIFFPWLKDDLEKDGHQVFCPDLPNPREPNIEEQVNHILTHAKIDKNTVLVGHGLGGVVIMKLLEKANKKVAKVLFIDSFLRPEFTDHRRLEVEKSCDWKFNFAKIKKLSDEFIILADSAFSVVPEKQSYEMQKLFNAKLIFVQSEADHFNSEKEPTILEQLKNLGWVAVSEKDLPVELPDVKKYEPTGTGESPLAAVSKWVNTKCPVCGGPAKRETNTMPQWAGSCWYYLRYLDSKNKKKIFDEKKEKYWMPVDLYVGGAEHAVLHLLYARFWHKVLYDEGLVRTVEPFLKLKNQGIILGEDGQKMSKSRGNVINPDDVINTYGADTMRLYEMFMGPFEDVKPWSTKGIIGVRRFLERVWGLMRMVMRRNANKDANLAVERLLHKTIKKVTEDIENFKFNTAISAMMILANEMSVKAFNAAQFGIFLKLLSPFAPHIAEELWEKLGHKKSVHLEKWPKYDPSLIVEEEIDLVVQVNGKVREIIRVKANISEEEAKKVARESEKVKKWIEGKEIKKVVFVKGKLINIVV